MGSVGGNEIIDSNCYLGMWPTRELRSTSAADLCKLATRNGVDLCLVSSFDALFHRNYRAANQKLAKELRDFEGRLMPLPIEDPLSPLCERAEMTRTRIVPSYHRYSLANRRCQRFLKECESRGTTVFVSLRMRDERLDHPILRLRSTNLSDLISAFVRFPRLNVVVNNAKASEIQELLSKTSDNVRAGCEWSLPIGFVETMVDAHTDRRLVYGSNVPLHYYQSSLFQILMADIPEKSKRRILGENLREIL